MDEAVQRRAFSASVIAYGLLELWFSLSPYVLLGVANAEQQQLLQYAGFQAVVELPESIWWGLSFLTVAVCIGLLRRSRLARRMLLVLAVWNGVAAAFSGLVVALPLSAALGSFWGLFHGFVIALSYVGAVGHEFDISKRP